MTKVLTKEKIITVVSVVGYFAMWTVTWSAALADLQGHYPSNARCRQDMAFAMGWSLIPVAPWIVAPFVTGFYEHGFKFSCEKE